MDKLLLALQIRMQHALEDNNGVAVVEVILILVVLIALVLIFKTGATSLVSTIWEKITNNANGI